MFVCVVHNHVSSFTCMQFKAICESAQVEMPEDMAIDARMSLNREQGQPIDPLERFAAEERRVWRLAQQDMSVAER